MIPAEFELSLFREPPVSCAHIPFIGQGLAGKEMEVRRLSDAGTVAIYQARSDSDAELVLTRMGMMMRWHGGNDMCKYEVHAITHRVVSNMLNRPIGWHCSQMRTVLGILGYLHHLRMTFFYDQRPYVLEVDIGNSIVRKMLMFQA